MSKLLDSARQYRIAIPSVKEHIKQLTCKVSEQDLVNE